MKARRRLPIGQLLGRTLRGFREELFRRAQEEGFSALREPHLQVFGVIDLGGTRLTDLASRANMTPPSMAELVDELQAMGLLERSPDPADRRAKLIRPTPAGRRAMVQALRAVEDIERAYAEILGGERYQALVAALEGLLEGQAARRDAVAARSPSVDGSRGPVTPGG